MNLFFVLKGQSYPSWLIIIYITDGFNHVKYLLLLLIKNDNKTTKH